MLDSEFRTQNLRTHLFNQLLHSLVLVDDLVLCELLKVVPSPSDSVVVTHQGNKVDQGFRLVSGVTVSSDMNVTVPLRQFTSVSIDQKREVNKGRHFEAEGRVYVKVLWDRREPFLWRRPTVSIRALYFSCRQALTSPRKTCVIPIS